MRADPAEIRKKVDRKLLGGGLAFFSSITRKEVAKSEFEYMNTRYLSHLLLLHNPGS